MYIQCVYYVHVSSSSSASLYLIHEVKHVVCFLKRKVEFDFISIGGLLCYHAEHRLYTHSCLSFPYKDFKGLLFNFN